MSYLELRNLTVRYGAAVAVDDLSLSVAQGEFVSLLGPSGCGKTTTLQAIAGFVAPTGGHILLDSQDLAGLTPARRNLGIVFQSYALFPHMTVRDNVRFGLEMRGMPRAERDRRVAQMLKLVGLDGLADRYPRRMSGGQQQRVALARALAISPRLLLLDEPLSNLDAKLREEMQGELRRIQREIGTTTVLVTHDQAEALALSDRVVLMRQGRVEQVACPGEIYERPANDFVANFLGRANMLPATIALNSVGCYATFADYTVALDDIHPPGPILARLRPERIRLADAGLAGRMRDHTFVGHHWFYQIETALGVVGVLAPNVGDRPPAIGVPVHLAWQARDIDIGRSGAS
ncbi:MAG TPA: ABC transporter ATP-binding protein [Rhizomicrobium sp.]|nr:ABC transporter ATP-binding protein [Rhizomicrobium sp.]